MDKWTQAQISNQQALEEGYRESQRAEQERMVAAAALEEMERARKYAEEAARQRRYAEEAHNRAQGYRNNW